MLLTTVERAEPHILRAARDVVDLQGRMAQAELFLEQVLEAAPGGVTVGVRRDEHVGGEGGKAARHRPDVEVVHLDDVGVPRERRGYGGRLDPGRRRLEED